MWLKCVRQCLETDDDANKAIALYNACCDLYEDRQDSITVSLNTFDCTLDGIESEDDRKYFAVTHQIYLTLRTCVASMMQSIFIF